MATRIDEELDAEVARVKAVLAKAYKQLRRTEEPPDLEVMNSVQQNFHTRVPGGDYWSRFQGCSEDMSLRDYILENHSDSERIIGNHSQKFLNRTIGELMQDIFRALREAGMSDNLFDELAGCRERGEARVVLKREFSTVIPIIYMAYRELRKQGYTKVDLSSF